MSHESKGNMNASDFEVDSQDLHLQSKLKTIHIVDGVRMGLTTLALVAGITILGVSADALAVWDSTHVPASFLLPLWPDEFDIRPTVALVAGSAVIIVSNLVSLLFSKLQFIRNRSVVHTPITVAAPVIGLIGAVVAMAYFYTINTSTTVDTLQSWSCRWQNIAMLTRPHFGTLCKQSRAGLYLSVLLIPLEAIILGVAGYQVGLERYINSMAHGRKTSSPALS